VECPDEPWRELILLVYYRGFTSAPLGHPLPAHAAWPTMCGGAEQQRRRGTRYRRIRGHHRQCDMADAQKPGSTDYELGVVNEDQRGWAQDKPGTSAVKEAVIAGNKKAFDGNDTGTRPPARRSRART
jgi:hypothetical protein